MACIAAAGARKPAENANPHAAGSVRVPRGTSEVAYCKGCHPSGCSAPHPELVKMDWAGRGKVVLDDRGEITCGSCHTPGFKSRSEAFLARDQKGLCCNCHYGSHAISDAHKSNRPCASCHADIKLPGSNVGPSQSHVMKTDIDTECLRCHYDGPITHPIGLPNKFKKASDLPLSADGKITCITCHVGHDQQDRFGNLLRKSNRHGGLCLSCHDDL